MDPAVIILRYFVDFSIHHGVSGAEKRENFSFGVISDQFHSVCVIKFHSVKIFLVSGMSN